MNPALETLLLAFTGDEALAIPSRALFLGAEPHPALEAWPDLTGWHPLKPMADLWKNAGFSLSEELPAGDWPLVLILPGKSRDEILAWFAIARARLKPGGRIVVAMPNTAGAARFEKELGKATGNIRSIQKHKCRAFQVIDDGAWNERLFGEWSLLGAPRVIPETKLITQAGIFSSQHIDPGSQLLADYLPANLSGRVADLGAGWGFLSDNALRVCSKIGSLDLYEADRRALDCAKVNLAAHARELAFHWHDVTQGIPERYDVILMNPPFHTGQATDVDLGRAFLTSAAAALRRGGRLLLVANRQLPYESVLDSLGFAWRKPVENASFKLLFADKR